MPVKAQIYNFALGDNQRVVQRYIARKIITAARQSDLISIKLRKHFLRAGTTGDTVLMYHPQNNRIAGAVQFRM